MRSGNTPVKVLVAGAAGRMGRQILKSILDNPRTMLVGGYDRPDHPDVGKDLGTLADTTPAKINLKPSLEKAAIDSGARVVIDFTNPDACLRNLAMASEFSLAAVIGTTGFTGAQKEEIREISVKRPIVLAPNMSVGVNMLFKLVSMAAQRLGESWDMEVVEAHHHFKEDAPSGTALMLAEIMSQAKGLKFKDSAIYCRQGRIGARRPTEIGIQTVRAGDIVGEHTVYMCGNGERLELIHRASSRSNFAQGAVRAAIWLAQQGPGLYDMQDVLGLR